VIWKVYPQEAQATDWLGGFVDFAVSPEDHGTRFSYSGTYEYLVEAETEAEVEAVRAKTHDELVEAYAAIFAGLTEAFGGDTPGSTAIGSARHADPQPGGAA
jgi:hypothetical protein